MVDLFGVEEIRALTWKEPFATMMLLGKIETRYWHTNFRGPVLICAGKGPYSEAEIMDIAGPRQCQNLLVTLNASGLKENPGHAIAVGRLVDCRRMTPEDVEKCFVKFDENRWCHVYEDVRRIAPFHFKGQQGWKILDNETKNQIILL